MFTPSTPKDMHNLSLQRPFDKAFWHKKGFVLAALFTVVWLYFIWDYLFASGWWAGRNGLTPAEFVGNICGLFLPVIIAFFIASYADRQNQLAIEAQTLRSYLNELIYPTEVGAVYTHSLTEALKQQVLEFKQAFFDVNAQTAEMAQQTKSWLEDIHIQSQQLDYKTQSCVDYIAQSMQNLTNVVGQSLEHGYNLANALDTQNKTLATTSEKTTALVAKMANLPLDALNKTIDGVENKIGELQTVIQKCTEFSNQQNAFAKTSLSNTDAILQQQTQSLTYIDDLMQSQVKIMHESDKTTKEYHHNLNAFAGNTAEKVKKLQADFAMQIEFVIDEADKALSKINTIQSAFGATANNLDVLTGKMIEIEETNQQILSDIEHNLAQPIEIAAPLVKSSEDTIDSPTPSSIQTTVDLLNDATNILDELQKLSVDMAHIFSPKSEDALWKKYYNGDKTVFMRHVRKNMEGDKHKNILKLYEEDPTFSATVAQYMQTFEEMMKKTGIDDENKIITSILIGSDVGRLYMVLADVLHKDME